MLFCQHVQGLVFFLTVKARDHTLSTVQGCGWSTRGRRGEELEIFLAADQPASPKANNKATMRGLNRAQFALRQCTHDAGILCSRYEPITRSIGRFQANRQHPQDHRPGQSCRLSPKLPSAPTSSSSTTEPSSPDDPPSHTRPLEMLLANRRSRRQEEQGKTSQQAIGRTGRGKDRRRGG